MADINARKRGNKWEYYFEIAKMDGKRKRISKGGFNTKAEAVSEGVKAKEITETIEKALEYYFRNMEEQ